MPKEDLAGEMNNLAVNAELIRGDLGYGRKVSSRAIKEASKFGPVDVHYYDDKTKERTIKTTHDISAIIADNKRQRLSGHDGYSPAGDLKKVATIPQGVVQQFYNQGIDLMKDEHWEYVKSMLDSNEFIDLRTSGGKISSKPRREYLQPIAKNPKKEKAK
jgi:hypothetical protein